MTVEKSSNNANAKSMGQDPKILEFLPLLETKAIIAF